MAEQHIVMLLKVQSNKEKHK